MVLAMMMLFCSAPGASAAGRVPTWEERVADQRTAVAANEALMQYFYNHGWISEYPDYYGGTYIEENVLHVRLVSPSEQTMAVLKEIFYPYADTVVYEYCDISRTDAQKKAEDVAHQLINKGYDVS